MNPKDIGQKIEDLIASGVPKSEVFRTLSGDDVKDRTLAYIIAARIDPRRCEANKWRIRFLVMVACVEVVFSFLVCLGIGMKISPLVGLALAIVGALVSFLLARGIQRNKVTAYNAVMFLLFSLISTLAISGETTPPASQALDTTNSVPCAAIRLRIVAEQSYEIEWRIHFENKEEAIFIRNFIGLPGIQSLHIRKFHLFRRSSRRVMNLNIEKRAALMVCMELCGSEMVAENKWCRSALSI